MFLLIQIVGSALILISFLALQLGRTLPQSRLYLVVNALGSLALAASALQGSQWGFVVLESVWFAASLHGLLRRRRDTGTTSN